MNFVDEQVLVLIVDDNLQNLQVIGNIVKEIGCKVAVAQNGKQALDFLQKREPDLILLDIMMPEMDGFTLCQYIHEHDICKNVPIIFVTALADRQSIVKAFDTGGVDYITKPFIKEEVQARIKVHLKLKKAMEKLKSMSVTDEMTGVFNRRYAYQVLDREISMAKREQKSFVICYVDIDNLKTINDTYGHDAGDQLIKEVVNGFKGVIRGSDYLFRMGGDEFMLVFPNTTLEHQNSMVSRLQQELNQKKIHGMSIDFSFGFSIFDQGDDTGCEELIKKADTLMYDQKMKKKNANKKGGIS